MEELVSSGVLSKPIVEDRYTMNKKITNDVTLSAEASPKYKPILDPYFTFTKILPDIYTVLNLAGNPSSPEVPLYDVFLWLEESGAFTRSTKKSIFILQKILQEFSDVSKALNDTKFEKRIESERLNFNAFILDVLEFYTREVLKLCQHEILQSPNRRLSFRTEFKKIADFFVDVKFRKSKYPLNEFIQQLILSLSDFGNSPQNHALLFVYSYDGLTDKERYKNRFKKNMQESFQGYSNSIHFFPVGINRLGLLKEDILELNREILESKRTKFKLKSQQINLVAPNIDDHYSPELFNSRNNVYEIRFKPMLHIEQWRFGIKFSSSNIFPQSLMRHEKDYPVFHLTKNRGSKVILATYYNPLNEPMETTTNLTNYSDENLMIKISGSSSSIIEAFDHNNQLILETPISIADYPYFRIFAWADNENQFEFEVAVDSHKQISFQDYFPGIWDLHYSGKLTGKEKVKIVDGYRYFAKAPTAITFEHYFDIKDILIKDDRIEFTKFSRPPRTRNIRTILKIIQFGKHYEGTEDNGEVKVSYIRKE